MTDEDIWALRRGGNDPSKVYNAYLKAHTHPGQPTVILAHTVKGYGLGEVAEARMTAHQQKKLPDADLLKIRDRFDLELSDEQVTHLEFHRPAEESAEMRYLRERVRAQGGSLPARYVRPIEIKAPPLDSFEEPGPRQDDCADHPGRGAHLRHGIAVPRIWHLREPRAAL
jgi:pyruvate dehydrogenase E1 component